MIRVICLKTMQEAPPPRHAVLCLGNFDGVHIGHRVLVAETIRQKELLSAALDDVVSGAWFFDIHPSHLLSASPLPRITSTKEKLAYFAELGLEYAFLADFALLKDYEPREFVKDILCDLCHCVYAVCGYNFRFAKMALGDANALVSLMDGRGSILNCVTLDGISVSSSAVRALVTNGDTELAAQMLGRPFCFSAPVLHGKELGQTIGVPTINQHFPKEAVRPKNGIYVSRTWIDGTPYPSVSNIGHRPTFDDGNTINCETHIIGYDGNLYGRELKVEFFKRLRGEIRFPSLDALKEQLSMDILSAKRYFEEQRRQI